MKNRTEVCLYVEVLESFLEFPVSTKTIMAEYTGKTRKCKLS